LQERGISLFVKREDLIHPYLSGNKWHKLKYNLEAAKRQNEKTLITFGGAYSNHIYAVAAAGKIFNFSTIGIIRGEEHLPLNPTLSFAAASGMKLYYVDRKTYRNKNSREFIQKLNDKFGDFYLLPEGGTNELAVKGCSEIFSGLNAFDYYCSSCSTGGTIAGIINGLEGKKYALGFAVLKGASFLKNDVKRFIQNNNGNEFSNWDINLDYHFGGYAKLNKQLLKFVFDFTTKTNIPIEPIYTGKMFLGIYDLISKGYFKEGSKIVALHSGGLQGLKGLTMSGKMLK